MRSLNVPGSDSSALQIEIVRTRRRGCDGRHLPSGREGGAAASQQLRSGDLGQDALRSELESLAQREVTIVCAISIESVRVARADARQQAKLRAADLRHRATRCRSSIGRGRNALRACRRDLRKRRLVARARDQCRRRAIAESEAGRVLPRDAAAAERFAELFCAGAETRDVVADVNDERRTWCRGEERVERRDAVDVGWGNAEALGNVVDGARADPADAVLHGVQHLEQTMALMAIRDEPRLERAVDGRALVRRRNGRGKVKVDQLARPLTGSMRTAQALNSAVPDFGSVTSIVSKFVATSSL